MYHKKKGTLEEFRKKECLRVSLYAASLEGEKLENFKKKNAARQKRYRERRLALLVKQEKEAKPKKDIRKINDEKATRRSKQVLIMRAKRDKLTQEERDAINAKRREDYKKKKEKLKAGNKIPKECQTMTVDTNNPTKNEQVMNLNTFILLYYLLVLGLKISTSILS